MDIGSLLYVFVNTATVGGVFVLLVYLGAVVVYTLLARWILRGGSEEGQS
jgi:NADH:ubiquinone oxidoreductase subunit 6 (subunit J)